MYLSLFTIHNLALLSDWLAETGELYVDVDLPHSGGSSFSYFIQTMDDFRALVAQQDWPEIRITVFRRMQYPLRGKIDRAFIEDVLAKMPDGQPYTILAVESESTSPQSYTFFGSGNSHEELEKELEELKGQIVAVGQDPFDRNRNENRGWDHREVFTASLTKNQNYYEKYAKNPERYEWVKDIWDQEK